MHQNVPQIVYYKITPQHSELKAKKGEGLRIKLKAITPPKILHSYAKHGTQATLSISIYLLSRQMYIYSL